LLEDGGGKEVRFIDISEEHPAYSKKEIEEMDADIDDLVSDGKIEKAIGLYRKLIRSVTARIVARENVVAEQLKEEFANMAGRKKVAVVQGGAHTFTYHAIKKEKPPIPLKYTFVPTPFVFHPDSIMVRRMRFFPKREITDEEWRRSFFADRKINYRGLKALGILALRAEKFVFFPVLIRGLTTPLRQLADSEWQGALGFRTGA